jgi:flagellar protein FliO/FliZ
VLRLLIAFFIPSTTWAAESAAPGIPSSTYLEATLALAVIVLLLVGTAWFARKLSGGKGFGHGGMKVVGGVALGPRERIVLVEVGDAWLVVGVVPGQIRTLHTLPRSTLPGDDLGTGNTPFAQWLKNISDRRQHD